MNKLRQTIGAIFNGKPRYEWVVKDGNLGNALNAIQEEARSLDQCADVYDPDGNVIATVSPAQIILRGKYNIRTTK